MVINVMYIPNERKALICGFVCTNKGSNSLTIAIVDPDMKISESEIKDVERATLNFNNPLNNHRFIKCLFHAKSLVGDKEWDALRSEAVQRFKLGTLIPSSKFFKDA